MKQHLTLSLLLMATAATGAQAQRDSTAVGNDSVAWSRTLDGPTIRAQRPLISQKIDRTSYDVQADEEARTESVLDVLRKVPMVSVDGDDNILVKGNSNFKIYRNGRFDPSTTRHAKDVLKAMPAGGVKRIEVISDPGAREDAEGADAILNIVMADSRMMDGMTGSLTGSSGTLRSAGTSAYIAAQLGRAIASANYGYNRMSGRSTASRGRVERTFTETGNTLRADYDGQNPGYIHHASIDASFDIDSLNLISASFGGYFYKVDVQGNSSQTMADARGGLLYCYDNHYWLPSYSHHTWNGRADYEHKTRRRGEQLTLSYMLALTRQHSAQEDSYTNMQNVPFGYTGFLLNTRERFTEHTLQADYVRPLWAGHRVEVGAKYINRRNGSHNRQLFYPAALQAATAAAFEHTTQIAAAYADYSFRAGRWTARAGLRYEHSYMRGHHPDGSGADFDKHLSDWVPQASVMYQLNGRQSLKLGYATAITRPGIGYLNPAVVSSPAMVNYGNARLKSVGQKSLSLTYLYTGPRLTVQIAPAFRHSGGGISERVFARDDVRYATYGNILSTSSWLMEGYAQWKPLGGTTLVGNIGVQHDRQNNREAALGQHCTWTSYYLDLRQQLPLGLLATANAYGLLGRQGTNIYSYTRPWNQYAISLQRSFLSDRRLTLRLRLNSPFSKRQHTRTRTTQGDIVGWGDATTNATGRYALLSLSYRFGKMKGGVKKTATTIENNDVVGGIAKGNN